MGTPVMLTETKGLWDLKNLKNNKNIFLMKENNVKLWKSKITENLSDADLLDTISDRNNKSNYNIESFDKSVINNLNLKTLSQFSL